MDDQQNVQLNYLHQQIAIHTLLGIVEEVDITTGKATVVINKEVVHGLRIMAQRAGANGKSWWLPAKGEQVVIIAPFGDMTEGIIIGSLYYGNTEENLSNTIPDFSTNPSVQICRKYYADGSYTSYDPEKHEYILHIRNNNQEDSEDIKIKIYNTEQQNGIDLSIKDNLLFSFKKQKKGQEFYLKLAEEYELKISHDEKNKNVLIHSEKKIKITSDDIELSSKNIELNSNNIKLTSENIELIAKKVNVKKA